MWDEVVNLTENEGASANITISIVVTVVVVITLVIILVKRKGKSINKISRPNSSINDCEQSGSKNTPIYLENNRFDPNNDVKDQANLLCYDTKREISRSSFTITKQIGTGNFGTVSKGELKGLYSPNSKTTVAIKSTKGPLEGTELRDFLHEIKVMSYTKAHLNLVSMIGSCSSEIENEKEMWLIIEFCHLGDLKTFIIQNKKAILNSTQNDCFNDRHLILWAHDISKGMEFLSNQHIMHGDLAARNIMLDESGRPFAKIADFGLSKRFYNNLEYEKQSRVFIPWKWMAYEFLLSDYFTLTSDVWSFGVVLWEIFSFGKIPYGHLDYNEVVKKLEEGYRLPCPSDVKNILSWNAEKVYEDVTKLCFKEDPDERGTFYKVVRAIEFNLSAEELSFYNDMEGRYRSERCNYYMQFGKRQT